MSTIFHLSASPYIPWCISKTLNLHNLKQRFWIFYNGINFSGYTFLRICKKKNCIKYADSHQSNYLSSNILNETNTQPPLLNQSSTNRSKNQNNTIINKHHNALRQNEHGAQQSLIGAHCVTNHPKEGKEKKSPKA